MRWLLEETDSTNTWLRREATEALKRGEALANVSAVRTRFQSAGRGQVGNHWESEAGANLLCSIYVRDTGVPVGEQFYLSELITLAIVSALDLYTDGIEVKWPNDIYWHGRKLAGILIENTLAGTTIRDTIVGLGLNVYQTEFTDYPPNPTSLKLMGVKLGEDCEVQIDELLTVITSKMYQLLPTLEPEFYGYIKKEYFKRLYLNDGKLHDFIVTATGERWQGRLEDILPTGHLVLTGEDGERRTFAFKEARLIMDNG